MLSIPPTQCTSFLPSFTLMNTSVPQEELATILLLYPLYHLATACLDQGIQQKPSDDWNIYPATFKFINFLVCFFHTKRALWTVLSILDLQCNEIIHLLFWMSQSQSLALSSISPGKSYVFLPVSNKYISSFYMGRKAGYNFFHFDNTNQWFEPNSYIIRILSG